MLIHRAVLLGVWVAGAPLPLMAQRGGAAGNEVSSQQTVRAIAVATTPWLAHDIFAGTQAATPSAWRIVVPDGNSVTWRSYRLGMYHVLNGRPAVASDTIVYYLEFKSVAVVGATLTWSVAVGNRWRCRGGWAASEVFLTFRSKRVEGGWAPAEKLDEIIGDRAPC